MKNNTGKGVVIQSIKREETLYDDSRCFDLADTHILPAAANASDSGDTPTACFEHKADETLCLPVKGGRTSRILRIDFLKRQMLGSFAGEAEYSVSAHQ
jgi:hypothetical protein